MAGRALACERSAARQTSGTEAYGKTAWSGTRCWCQVGGGVASPTGFANAVNSPMTEAKGIRLRGEHGISRQAIAQGRPECSACTCMLVCAFLCANCTRDRGCSVHPVFPAPSVFEGRKRRCKTRAQCAARKRSYVQPSLRAQRSNPCRGKGRVGCFAALAMTLRAGYDDRALPTPANTP